MGSSADTGDFVQVTGGFIATSNEGNLDIGPVPEGLIGAYGQLVATGHVITETIEPGPVWGHYQRRELKQPVDEIRLKILSGDYRDQLLDVDGIIWRRLSPLESLALQKAD